MNTFILFFNIHLCTPITYNNLRTRQHNFEISAHDFKLILKYKNKININLNVILIFQNISSRELRK